MPQISEDLQEYRCSITGQIMIDPVFTADGFTYEREAIENWLQTHNTSPQTNEDLEHRNLTPNQHMRSNILGLLSKHPELYDKGEVYLPKSWVRQCVIAIKGNQPQEVQKWLNKDRRLLTLKLEGDSTALHLACEFSSPELVDALLKILKQKNQSILPGAAGFKPLHLNVLLDRALTNGDHAQCELLLTLGAEVEQPETSTRNTLLHRMVIEGRPQAISWLLEHKAVLESQNIQGDTPLMLSIKGDNKRLADFLLFRNANPDIKNAQQKTPLCIAVEKGDTEAARLLLAHGSDPIFSCQPIHGILHIAAARGDLAMLQLLLLTKASDLIDAQDIDGNTALHLAAQAGREDVITRLLEAGAYHKIKNEQDQTSIELARAQQKPKTANFIVQTVRGLKKVKLEETAKLHQVVAEQASEIANLKNALQSQGQGFKVQLSGMQQINEKLIADMEGMQVQIKILQPAPQPLIPSSPTLIFRPPSPSMSFHVPAAVPNINPKEVEEFLRLVAEGEQDKAEAMLKSNPALALVPGDVTDLSKRTFTNITGFQYAVWALDWHMWTMIKKYLPHEDARKQAQGFETGSWVSQHGVSANWQNLLDAQQKFFAECDAQNWNVANITWVQQVGGMQLLLPAHVINEYCRPSRSFSPCPDFSKLEPDGAWRVRVTNNGEWFTAKVNNGSIGIGFGVARGGYHESGLTRYPTCNGGGPSAWRSFPQQDHQVLPKLFTIRQQQRDALLEDLKSRNQFWMGSQGVI